MSTISASTTSTTAYKVTADTTGALVIQTGASPTTALTISSAQVANFVNTPTVNGTPIGGGGFAGPSSTVYTTAGSFTFTIPSGVTKLKVTVVGGGGGAPFSTGCAVTNGSAGGTSSVASGTQTISTVSATGGAGGNTGTVSGGLGSGGDLNARGGASQSGTQYAGFSSLSFTQAIVSPTNGATGLLGTGGFYYNAAAQGGGAGGGTAVKWLTGLTAGNTLSVTVGAGGAGGSSANAGGAGVVIFEY